MREQAPLPAPHEDSHEPEQDVCYTGLPAETVHSLQQRALRIRALVIHSVIEIGRELAEAKKEIQPYKAGGFKGWVETHLQMTEQYAYTVMNVYEQFGKTKNFLVSRFVRSALLFLAAPSVPQEARDEALHLAEANEKITVERARAIIKAWRAQESEEEARLAHADAESGQQQYVAAQETIATLTQRLTELEQMKAALSTPSPQIKEVIPPEVAARLEALQTTIELLTEQRDALAKKAEELSADLETWREVHEEDRDRALRDQRARQQWREVADACSKQVLALLGRFPSPFDARVFEMEEWDRLSHIELVAHRLLTACRTLRESPRRIMVDADP